VCAVLLTLYIWYDRIEHAHEEFNDKSHKVTNSKNRVDQCKERLKWEEVKDKEYYGFDYSHISKKMEDTKRKIEEASETL
jgi:hypothetical protein